MLTTATALSSWAKVIKKTLDLAGHDGAALVREAGLDPRLLDDPNARYPVSQTGQLWKIALRETRDPCFGFKVASQVTQGTFHALSYSIASSSTLKDAFERMERYARIFSDAGELKFRVHGEEYHFTFTPKAALPDESVDAFVSVYVRMCRALAGDRSLSPTRIELRRPRPADASCFDKVLRAPLSFGASRNLLVYARADLERPLEGGNPELASHHDEIARKYLARFSRDNLMARVESVLLDRLPHGEPSQGDIAQALHLSARTLQRKLAEQGKSYKEILDTTRHDLAVSYLKDREYSISEVTYLLGFSDTSSFTRAFRRWTGRSPTEFRQDDSSMARRVTKA
jgi:AraC-like DNA-binding protein